MSKIQRVPLNANSYCGGMEEERPRGVELAGSKAPRPLQALIFCGAFRHETQPFFAVLRILICTFPYRLGSSLELWVCWTEAPEWYLLLGMGEHYAGSRFWEAKILPHIFQPFLNTEKSLPYFDVLDIAACLRNR